MTNNINELTEIHPVNHITMDEVVLDELKILSNDFFNINFDKIYGDKLFNMVVEGINEYGYKYILKSLSATVIHEQPFTEEINLEPYFRKTARLWKDILLTGKVKGTGSLGGIICIPLSLYDKVNNIYVDDNFKPIYSITNDGKTRIPNVAKEASYLLNQELGIEIIKPEIIVLEENLVRRFIFHFTVMPYKIKETESLPDAALFNKIIPFPCFSEEGAENNFSFNDYDNIKNDL